MGNFKNNITINISPLSIFMVLGIIFLIFLVWILKSVLVMFFVAFILASTLKQFVGKIHNKINLPRSLITTTILIGTISIVGGLGYVIFKDATSQLANLNLEQVAIRVVERVELVIPGDQTQVRDDIQNFIVENRQNEQGEILNLGELFLENPFVLNIFNGVFQMIFALITIFFVAFYILDREGNLYDGILKYLEKEKAEKIKYYLTKIETSLGRWLMAQISLMLIIGLVTYIGLALPQLFLPATYYSFGRFAAAIGTISGLLEVVPTLGPLISAVIAIILSIATAPADAVVGQTIFVALFFFLIQQIENALIVPSLMKQSVGLDPIITILGVISAYSLFGTIGALLVIPFLATLQIAAEFFLKEKIF